MARPVVVSAAVAPGIDAVPLVEFDVANDAREFTHKVVALMDPSIGGDMGRQARKRVAGDCNWDAQLARFGELIERTGVRRKAHAR